MSASEPPMTRLFVGNLHWSLDDNAFRELISSTGITTVTSARVARANANGAEDKKNKGFGFVDFNNHEHAEAAIAKLHHLTWQGRNITASWATQGGRGPTSRSRHVDATSATPISSPSISAGHLIHPSPTDNKATDLHFYPIPGGAHLIDIGANLTSHRFTHSASTLLSRAAQAGLSHIIITGTSVSGSQQAAQVVKKFDPRAPVAPDANVQNSSETSSVSPTDMKNKGKGKLSVRLFSTAGVHPHDATKTLENYPNDQWVAVLEKLIIANEGVVVSVGECGLDYDRMFSSKEDQKLVFIAQLELAKKHNLPVFLHCRDARSTITYEAHHDFVAILKRYPTVRKCVHCYTDTSLTRLKELTALDCYIGITGWVADPRRGQGLAALIDQIPTGRLMIETDAPFLIPLNRELPKVESGGKRKAHAHDNVNEPAYLGWVAKKVAECLETPVEDVARETTKTAIEFFNLV